MSLGIVPESVQRGKRTKWTEQMNAKVLLCKRKVQNFVRCGDLQRNSNRGKKGYRALITELWLTSGFVTDLNISTQTLGDQA